MTHWAVTTPRASVRNAPQSSTTPTWFAKLGGDGRSRSHLFCPLARHLGGRHPTHSLEAVVDSPRASELRECRCRPDLADCASAEAAVVTKCKDPACAGAFRVVAHPRHGLGGPARNNARGAASVVLRPRRSAWEVELGVTDTGAIRSPARRGGLRMYVIFAFCRKARETPACRSEAIAAAFDIVGDALGAPLARYALDEAQIPKLSAKKGDNIERVPPPAPSSTPPTAAAVQSDEEDSGTHELQDSLLDQSGTERDGRGAEEVDDLAAAAASGEHAYNIAAIRNT